MTGLKMGENGAERPNWPAYFSSIIGRKESKVLNLGPGYLVFGVKGHNGDYHHILFYDPGDYPRGVRVEFFTGDDSAYYHPDAAIEHRLAVDSTSSVVRLVRAAGLLPYASWDNHKDKRAPFPMYTDHMCVIAWINPDGSVIIRPEGSIVPHLERTSNISGINFVSLASEPDLESLATKLHSPANQAALQLPLSINKDGLTQLVGMMASAYKSRAAPAELGQPYTSLVRA